MVLHYWCHSPLMSFRDRKLNQYTMKTNELVSYPKESSRIIIDESRQQHQNNHAALYLICLACSRSYARGVLISIMKSTATQK